MTVKASTSGPFTKGVDASAGVLTQPKGTVPRASNLLLTKRGSLHTCDGSLGIHEFNGVPTAGRGKMMAIFLFAPTGVSRYYLALAKALDLHLGAPRNLTLITAAGGSLGAATYFYKVTANDGTGGETTASVEASIATGANGKNTLTWNIVPSAQSYNIYRSTSAGTETILSGSPTAILPVPQSAAGNLTVSFVDDGTTATNTVFNVSIMQVTSIVGTLYTANWTLSAATSGLSVGMNFTYTAGTNPNLTGTVWTITGIVSSTQFIATESGAIANVTVPGQGSLSGTFVTGGLPPVADNTQQTALFKMPIISGSSAQVPVSYNNTNIVALFPADPLVLDGGGGGGSGGGGRGGGGTGGGATGGGTASGGVVGNVSLIPQIVQFTNQAVLALGNGISPMVYSDPATPVNQAVTAAVTAISVDAFGVVTITFAIPHGINTTQGFFSNITIANILNAAYNSTATNPAFVVIAIPSATQVKVVNLSAIGQAASSGGTATVTTIPIISNFVPSFPVWVTAVNYAVNSIIVPTASNGHFYKAVQGGVSGTVQPTFPLGSGQRVAETTPGSVIWQEAGLLNTAAPPPPGAAHVTVYAGSLWVWDTSPTNTATGLDGPCSLRMSDVNNMNSWNPINQAFLDKDDGTEGMGLTAFTIAAQGIPPIGSLIAFKLYATYQIVGVFGSSNFSIQRGETDMGCTAPRTIQFLPGFGIGRMTHLGVAVFDSVNDRVISEQVRPYLFPLNDTDISDIVVADANNIALSWSAQTANPPMYATAIPIGTSGGALTRLLCFDLVLKGWAIVDLPFPISCLMQARTTVANPVTIMGSFSDGTIQRWQSGDVQWATSAAGSGSPAAVAWSMRSPTSASKDPDQRLYCRRVVVRGYVDNSGPTTMTIQPRVAGVARAAQTVPLLATGDVQVQAAVGITHDRFDAVISGSGQITIDAVNLHIVPKPLGVLAGPVS